MSEGEPDPVAILQVKQTPLSVEEWIEQASEGPQYELEKENTHTRAWLITSQGTAYFLKWVEVSCYEDSLAKDAAICSQNLHPAITRLLNTIHTADGIVLVFERVYGLNLGEPNNRKRFFSLPVEFRLQALRSIFDALAAIAAEGWIIVDFYEGNVLYDFSTRTVKIFDFEEFQRGPGFNLRMDRNYGSSRLMAPEEFIRGALIDQRSNVYTLGRYAINALSPRLDEEWRSCFQADEHLANVLEQATRPNPQERYPTVREFVAAFDEAAG